MGQTGGPSLKDDIEIPKFENCEDPNGPPLNSSYPCEVG